jgi:hypothetical protein
VSLTEYNLPKHWHIKLAAFTVYVGFSNDSYICISVTYQAPSVSQTWQMYIFVHKNIRVRELLLSRSCWKTAHINLLCILFVFIFHPFRSDLLFFLFISSIVFFQISKPPPPFSHFYSQYYPPVSPDVRGGGGGG